MPVSRRQVLVGASAAAAAILVAGAWLRPRPVEVETARASFSAFEQSIEEDARTRVRERYVVAAPLAGRLERITLREGDAVRAGERIASLQPTLAPLLDARTITEQRARADAAGSGVHRAETRVHAARIALERARLDLSRSEQLARQGFVAPTRLESDRLALQAAEQDLAAAADGQRIAGFELAQARAALAALGPGVAAGRSFEVVAPIAGRVLRVHQASETAVGLGTPLVEIGDTAALEIVAELLTTDALQARPGAPVRIERWGGPGLLEGRVRRVEPAAFTKVSALGVEEQRVRVLIDFTSPRESWAVLGDGYRVGVRVVTRAEPRALTVPVSAVFPMPGAAGEGAWAAFVVEQGRARLVPLALEARNAAQAWIAKGPAEGAEVIVYPPPAVADGKAVRVRAR